MTNDTVQYVEICIYVTFEFPAQAQIGKNVKGNLFDEPFTRARSLIPIRMTSSHTNKPSQSYPYGLSYVFGDGIPQPNRFSV